MQIQLVTLTLLIFFGSPAFSEPTKAKKISNTKSSCFVESTAGEYPTFTTYKGKKVIYAPKSDGISSVHLSPLGRFIAFSSGEIDRIDIPGEGNDYGLVIVDCKEETAKGYRKGRSTSVRWWWKDDAGLTFTDGDSLQLGGEDLIATEFFPCYFTGFKKPRPSQKANCAFRTQVGALQLRGSILKKIKFDTNNLAEGSIGKEGCFWLHKNRTLRKVHCFDNGADPFDQGYSRHIGSNGKFGYVDEKLNIVIPAQYDFAFPFNGGQAKVCMGCKSVPSHPKSEHSVSQGGQWKIVDVTGTVVKNCLGATKNEDCLYLGNSD